MSIPRHARKQLPKARWISVTWRCPPIFPDSPRVYMNRFANARQFTLWRLVIVVRAPWLERSARQIHPHLFENDRYTVDEHGRTGWTIP